MGTVISNGRGTTTIVEATEDGVELTIEHGESGGAGVVLTREQAIELGVSLILATESEVLCAT